MSTEVMEWREPPDDDETFEVDETYLAKEGGEVFAATWRDGCWEDHIGGDCVPDTIMFRGDAPWVLP